MTSLLRSFSSSI